MPRFDAINDIPPDPMHLLDLGITKKLYCKPGELYVSIHCTHWEGNALWENCCCCCTTGQQLTELDGRTGLKRFFKMAKEDEKEEENPNPGILHYLIANHLWLFAIWLVPISVLYDVYWWLHARFTYWFCRNNSHVRHDDKVKHVQQQVREWKSSGCQQPMCTARPGWKSITLQQLTYKDRMYKVEIDMANIIKIDEDKRLVRVEPMVTIGKLNDFLVSYGWTLPVVPELDDLTIGGLVMGGGIESTSHKYGLFQYICQAFELVLGDATKVWVSPTDNPDLFSAIPFSYGTLGFLTAVDIDIIPYKPFIQLTYHNVSTLDEVVDTFTKVTNDKTVDSVEGIMYTLDTGVIMSGIFVDKVPSGGKINRVSKWYKPWFYKHVQTFMKNDKESVEYIPTVDFFHRHNKAYFWLTQYIITFANNPIFRYLFGWSMPPKFSLLKLMRQKLIPEEQNVNFMCQDFGIHLKDLKESLRFIHRTAQIYPVWLCPTRHCIHEGLEDLSAFAKEDVHVDVGVYGYSPIKGYNPIVAQRALERFAIDHNGYVAPYAETQLTREEFNEMFGFGLKTYHRLRREMDCEKAFPHVYEKISKLGRKQKAEL